MGKCYRLFTSGCEWDGKVGRHMGGGMGRDYTISCRDGKPVGKKVGNMSEIGRAHKR